MESPPAGEVDIKFMVPATVSEEEAKDALLEWLSIISTVDSPADILDARAFHVAIFRGQRVDYPPPADILDASRCIGFIGVYLPIYIRQADYEVDYSAIVGYDRQEAYEVDEKHNENNYTYLRRVTKERTVTDWHPRSGSGSASINRVYSIGDGNEFTSFPTQVGWEKQDVTQFSPKFLGKFVRCPALQTVADKADERFQSDVGSDGEERARAKFSGHQIRDFTSHVTYTPTGNCFIYYPYYRLDYAYGGKTMRVLLDARNATRIHGVKPVDLNLKTSMMIYKRLQSCIMISVTCLTPIIIIFSPLQNYLLSLNSGLCILMTVIPSIIVAALATWPVYSRACRAWTSASNERMLRLEMFKKTHGFLQNGSVEGTSQSFDATAFGGTGVIGAAGGAAVALVTGNRETKESLEPNRNARASPLKKRADAAFAQKRFLLYKQIADDMKKDGIVVDREDEADTEIVKARAFLPKDFEQFAVDNPDKLIEVTNRALAVCADLPEVVEPRAHAKKILDLRANVKSAISEGNSVRAMELAEQLVKAIPGDMEAVRLAEQAEQLESVRKHAAARRWKFLVVAVCILMAMGGLVYYAISLAGAYKLEQATKAYTALKVLDADRNVSVQTKIDAYVKYINEFHSSQWMIYTSEYRLKALRSGTERW
ncbi:MAG: hypothetical protein NTY46_16985 [Candidatus Sumerlaeota bacterium]|nr:hypothetical protein [Candidatus Sumerlaeota bacterium]